MTIFAIIPQPNPNQNTGLPAAIMNTYPNGWHALDNGAGWLVSTFGTPQTVSNALGITDGRSGSAIVIEVAAYWGRANPNTWSWIQSNWGR